MADRSQKWADQDPERFLRRLDMVNDLLGPAFEEQGWRVLRVPDVIWGGDVEEFHPPPSTSEGITGFPPCQAFDCGRGDHQAHG